MSVTDFGPRALKAVREHMVDVRQLSRTEINKRVSRINRDFESAVDEELIPPSVNETLIPIPGINRDFQKPGIEESAGLLRRSAALLIPGMRIRAVDG